MHNGPGPSSPHLRPVLPPLLGGACSCYFFFFLFGRLSLILALSLGCVSDDDAIFYTNAESAQIKRNGAIKLNSVMSVFHTVVSKRPSYAAEPTLSAEALACRNHHFVGEQLGGLDCQICGFSTDKRVWKCRLGCDIALCGACMDRWRSKINRP